MPCRLGLQSTGLLPRPTDDTPELHRRLKAALDPNGILAPGRYDLGGHDAYRRLPEGD
jgi:4-cresol dehydrogenase (hydroxylating)